MDNKVLTTFDIAEHCHVNHRTVRQWISDGKLKSYRTPGNHSRVKIDDFIHFLRKYKIPIPEEFVQFEERKKRILVVDDDDAMVMIIKHQLNSDNRFAIDEAYDGFSAGKKFYEFKPDLITLDIRMPYLDGFEVLKQLRRDPLHKNVKIIVISGVTDKHEQNKIMDLGADQFLVKPFEREQLISAVTDLLGVEQ